MAWMYRYVVWISLLHTTFSLETDGEPEQIWRTESRKLVGSYKIVNRRVRPSMNKRGTGDSGFVFPGLTSRVGEDSDNMFIPDECKRTGICESIPNYPEDIVNSIVSDLERRNASLIFNKDVLLPPQVAERIGAEENNLELCKSIERIFIPQAAQTASEEWHIILNTKNKPQQTFRVEICDDTESACGFVTFQTAYSGRCIQKYSLREMIALGENNEPVKKSFRVPSCCSCVASSLE